MRVSRLISLTAICTVFFVAYSTASQQTPELERGSRVVSFVWRPPEGDPAAYQMSAIEDQHRIVFLEGVQPGGSYPVVVAFHGQPQRGTPPQKYTFPRVALETAQQAVAGGKVKPFILILPVFRFRGENWPDFDAGAFRREVEKHLKKEGISPTAWYALGHSGAAGCGGLGLNGAEAMSPRAVGFIDTCLGKGWQSALKKLRKRKIEALNVHTVETAGFRPKQRPEYQSWFDFGRAYGPVGMNPIPCPKRTPGKKLRDQKYRCAASPDGLVRGFVVDAGEGVEAHRAIVAIGMRYFLDEYLGPSVPSKR